MRTVSALPVVLAATLIVPALAAPIAMTANVPVAIVNDGGEVFRLANIFASPPKREDDVVLARAYEDALAARAPLELWYPGIVAPTTTDLPPPGHVTGFKREGEELVARAAADAMVARDALMLWYPGITPATTTNLPPPGHVTGFRREDPSLLARALEDVVGRSPQYLSVLPTGGEPQVVGPLPISQYSDQSWGPLPTGNAPQVVGARSFSGRRALVDALIARAVLGLD